MKSKIKSSLFVILLVVLSLNNLAHAVEGVPLRCMKTKTFQIRVSDVIQGCDKTEVSLGAGAIPAPLVRPTKLDDQILYRFQAAQAAAKKDGVGISITSGYRSLSRQKILFARAIKNNGNAYQASKWVAPPLVSHHPWGVAIDVNYPTSPEGAKWLEVNGWKFGLCRVFENEWWHFEPVIAPGWKCPQLVPDATFSR